MDKLLRFIVRITGCIKKRYRVLMTIDEVRTMNNLINNLIAEEHVEEPQAEKIDKFYKKVFLEQYKKQLCTLLLNNKVWNGTSGTGDSARGTIHKVNKELEKILFLVHLYEKIIVYYLRLIEYDVIHFYRMDIYKRILDEYENYHNFGYIISYHLIPYIASKRIKYLMTGNLSQNELDILSNFADYVTRKKYVYFIREYLTSLKSYYQYNTDARDFEHLCLYMRFEEIIAKSFIMEKNEIKKTMLYSVFGEKDGIVRKIEECIRYRKYACIDKIYDDLILIDRNIFTVSLDRILQEGILRKDVHKVMLLIENEIMQVNTIIAKRGGGEGGGGGGGAFTISTSVIEWINNTICTNVELIKKYRKSLVFLMPLDTDNKLRESINARLIRHHYFTQDIVQSFTDEIDKFMDVMSKGKEDIIAVIPYRKYGIETIKGPMIIAEMFYNSFIQTKRILAKEGKKMYISELSIVEMGDGSFMSIEEASRLLQATQKMYYVDKECNIVVREIREETREVAHVVGPPLAGVRGTHGPLFEEKYRMECALVRYGKKYRKITLEEFCRYIGIGMNIDIVKSAMDKCIEKEYFIQDKDRYVYLP